MDWLTLLSYLTGFYFIKPDMEAATLIPTASLVHLLDAILCRLIAGNRGHNRDRWTVAGLAFGIWALGLICLFPDKKGGAKED